MKGTRLYAAALLAATQGGAAWAHGGGLNAEGCHNNRKTGGYHCHRGSRSSSGAGSGLSLYGSTPPPADTTGSGGRYEPLYLTVTPRAKPVPAPRAGLLPSTPETIGPPPAPPASLPDGDAALHALIRDMQESVNALRSEVLDLRLRLLTLESR